MSGEKILVVDDEQDIVELIEYNLLKEGYKVRTALNG
ncbi:MAG: DNA-binding response regulator, partial [Flavobacteriales bacterium]